jgi:hypothetical protein
VFLEFPAVSVPPSLPLPPTLETEPPFRRWRVLAAKKVKEPQKQIPITVFLKIINCFIYKFTFLKILLFCEVFYLILYSFSA